jgi:hypothetical protein
MAQIKELLKEAFKAGQATASIMTAEMFNDDEFNEWYEDKIDEQIEKDGKEAISFFSKNLKKLL